LAGHSRHNSWHVQTIGSKTITLSEHFYWLYEHVSCLSVYLSFVCCKASFTCSKIWCNLSNMIACIVLQVTWLETDLFTLGLGFLMLSMGLTLTFEDFRRCMRNPWTVRSYTCSRIHLTITFWRGWLIDVFVAWHNTGGCRISCPVFS